jgi:hypothetical protein
MKICVISKNFITFAAILQHQKRFGVKREEK